MPGTATRKARLEARISEFGLDMIKRAAEIEGRSVSDFVVSVAQDAAAKRIREAQIIELSLRDQRAFAEAILNPPDPGPGLRNARDAHRRLIRQAG